MKTRASTGLIAVLAASMLLPACSHYATKPTLASKPAGANRGTHRGGGPTTTTPAQRQGSNWTGPYGVPGSGGSGTGRGGW